MLLELTVGNFRSFRDDATLSMVSTKLKSRDPAVDEVTRHQLSDDLSVLHTAAIYGANASGKSNLIRALGMARRWIMDSAREGQVNDPIPTVPFLLDEDSVREPTHVEIVFVHNAVQYRYGFEVDVRHVHREWLFKREKRETALLEREGQDFTLRGPFKKEQEVARRTRENALFLSTAAQLDVAFAEELLGWFRKIEVLKSTLDLTTGYTAACLRSGEFEGRIEQMLAGLDVGIRSFRIEEASLPWSDDAGWIPDELRAAIKDHKVLKVNAVHPVYDASGGEISERALPLEQESDGTQKLFALAGPIVQTLAAGDILVIDEFDNRLHPLISRQLVELFHNPATNPHHAQLIIATHDTHLLSHDLFRRDQIWFVEKDKRGGSVLYSLAEIQVRNDASLEADYFRGRYGAVPFLGGLRRVFISQPGDSV
jgi:predicted ATPase